MSVKNILVSIILPTYNGNHIWLSQAIDSVISQTYTNRELIIINDASTNDIATTILSFQQKDERIQYVMNERNLGLTQTLNRGIALSQGKYIARIDDDDIWHDKDKLKKQVEFMEANPEYGLCGTGVILINEEGKEIDAIVNRGGDENIRNAISGSNQFTHSSIMMKKSIVETVGCYHDTNITKYAEDYDLWLRIGLVAKFDNVQDYCIKYRARKGSISGKKRIHQAFNAFRVYLQYRNNYPNQITGIIKHLITVFVPQSIVNVLVKLYR